MNLSRFKYDETSPSCLTRDGLPVGYKCLGYYVFKIGKKKRVFAHRIIWQLFNGPIPEGYQIDHKDRNKGNNKIENLRLATGNQNMLNRVNPNINGLIGVKMHKRDGLFESRVVINGKQRTVGTFKSKYDAALHRDLVAWDHYGEFGVYNYPEFVQSYKKIKIEK